MFLGSPPRWSYLGVIPIIAGTLLVTKSRSDAAKEREEVKLMGPGTTIMGDKAFLRA